MYVRVVQPYCEQGLDNLSDCLRGPDVLNFKTCLSEEMEVSRRQHSTWIVGCQTDYRSTIRGFVNQKWVPYSQRYLFNVIHDTITITLTLLTLTVTVRVTLTILTLPTLLTLILDIGLSNPRIIEPSDYRYITVRFTPM